MLGQGVNVAELPLQRARLVNRGATAQQVGSVDGLYRGGPAYYMGGCQFIYNGLSGARFEFQPSGNNQYNAWVTTATGPASGLIQSTLVLPPGVVSITIDSLFSIDARTGAVCDYTDGVNFSFGDLPAGLTWTSESGVFLSATPAGSTSEMNMSVPV